MGAPEKKRLQNSLGAYMIVVMVGRRRRVMIDILEVARKGQRGFMEKTTPEWRSRNARKAIKVRWRKYREQQKLQTQTQAQ